MKSKLGKITFWLLCVFIYIYLEYLILPILGLVVSGLVLGYILFPEKYLKTMKGELDYG